MLTVKTRLAAGYGQLLVLCLADKASLCMPGQPQASLGKSDHVVMRQRKNCSKNSRCAACKNHAAGYAQLLVLCLAGKPRHVQASLGCPGVLLS